MKPFSEIYTQRFETAHQASKYLLIYNERYFECSAHLYAIVSHLQNASDYTEAINNIQEQYPSLSTQEVQSIITKNVLPIFDSSSKQSHSIFTKEILKESLINPISDRLSRLFKPSVFNSVITLTILFEFLYYFAFPHNNPITSVASIFDMLGIAIFIIASSLVHELGHASACKWHGIKHGGIGLSIYINIPVLYTDVSPAWKLNRKERLIVNLGGVYFQCYVFILLFSIYAITRYNYISNIISILNISFLITLNPLFKFDGYWLLSDFLGIPNLRIRSKKAILTWLRFSRKNNQESHFFKGLSKKTKFTFVSYTIIVNLFLCYYICIILPQFMHDIIFKLPTLLETYFIYIYNRVSPPLSTTKELLTQLILVLVLFCILKPIIANLYKGVTSKKIFKPRL